jgi:hypothetical protein
VIDTLRLLTDLERLRAALEDDLRERCDGTPELDTTWRTQYRAARGAGRLRTGFFLSSFQKWREGILLREAPPVVFADLGYGVMDAAMVEAAAYCLEKGREVAA